MNFAFERWVLLFTRAEEIPVLASSLCKSYWSKPLPAFVKVVEEYVIFNFAINCKVHFSLEIWRKSILNKASAHCFSPCNARAHSSATSRARHTKLPYARRACTPRHRKTHWSVRRAGKLLCVTFMGAWTVPGGCIPLAGVPTAVRHWATGPPHVAAPCCPHRACTGDVVAPRTS
jgi:hypothetical protein